MSRRPGPESGSRSGRNPSAANPASRPGSPGGSWESARAHAFIVGLVQGVSYRAAARAEAERLGVSGWVRNLPGGSVELAAEGPREEVERLLAWCRRGPSPARVDQVEVTWEPAQGEPSGFAIRR
jgi:acylphosphatase